MKQITAYLFKKSKMTTLLFAAVSLSALPLQGLAADDQWQTSFKTAQTEASQQKKNILLDFTGSDWCPWCVKMDKEVFAKPEFSSFASKNLVLVKLDFPRSKEIPVAERKQNEALQKQYNIEGFPTFVLLDPSGKEIKRQEGYLEGGPSAFVKWAEAK